MTLLTSDAGRLAARFAPDRHPAAVYLARLAPGSRRTMRHALDTIASVLASGGDAESLNWPAVRYQHSQAVRTVLTERYRPASVNKMLSALRGVLKESWRLGYMTAEDYHRAADVGAVPSKTIPRGRALSNGEIAALFEACARDSSPAGVRDAAVLGLLYGAGMRRSEVVGLDVRDCRLPSGAVVVRRGKGQRERTVYATNGAGAALSDWLEMLGRQEGTLFVSINTGGRLSAHRLSGQAVLVILAKRAAQARVDAVSPHDLRRSMISHLLDAGADISTVQRLAGHANVQTTTRYDLRGERAKHRAAELLHVPYRRK